jgi:hypothetical protein
MTERELAETLHDALRTFGRDGERWCIAQASAAEAGMPPYLELVALPAPGYEQPGMANLYEQGRCAGCGAHVVSVSKRAVCPVCLCEVECT